MRNHDNGLCPFEEYSRLRTRILDAADEWLTYCDADPEIGIALERKTLDVELCGRDEARGREWYPLEPLTADGEADDDAVRDLADSICFVR